jgi:hypothetical protein
MSDCDGTQDQAIKYNCGGCLGVKDICNDCEHKGKDSCDWSIDSECRMVKGGE